MMKLQNVLMTKQPTTDAGTFISVNGKRSKEEWFAIREYLVETLSGYLQQPIEMIDSSIEESIVDEEALCCAIRSLPASSPLALTWEGRLGVEIIDGKPHASTSLFLFSQGKRITAAEQIGSYLELVYEPINEHEKGWHSLGWIEDIYDEFEHLTEYTGKSA